MSTAKPEKKSTDSKKMDEIDDGRFFAIVGYFSILCFVPLFLKKGNKFAEFHGRQGLVLFIVEVAAFMFRIIPIVGDLIFTLAMVIFVMFSAIGVIKVISGEYWEMPILGDVAGRINL